MDELLLITTHTVAASIHVNSHEHTQEDLGTGRYGLDFQVPGKTRTTQLHRSSYRSENN